MLERNIGSIITNFQVINLWYITRFHNDRHACLEWSTNAFATDYFENLFEITFKIVQKDV